MKKKAKSKDLVMDYVRYPILSTTATEFRFKGLSVIAIRLPRIATLVMGRELHIPGRYWVYPAGTSMKLAVSKTFQKILELACKNLKIEKKA